MVRGQTIIVFYQQVVDSFFTTGDSWVSRWVGRIWITALFLIGLANFSIFFNFGELPLDIADWSDITAPRLYTLMDAVKHGHIPLHIADPNGVKGVTDQFLTVPDIILSPQILLLRFLLPGDFLWINLLLLYTAGFLGLLLFRERMKIGLGVFSILFLLFNFNGHIIAHLAIGHATWMAYFLTPYFILLIGDLFENRVHPSWMLKIVVLQMIIFLQGGFHFFVWQLFFMLFIGVFNPEVRKTVFLASLASILGCMFRILPAGLVFTEMKLSFLGGFTTFNDLIRGVVVLVEPKDIFELFSTLTPYIGWWEFDYYLGWAGVIFILSVLFLAWRTGVYRYSPFYKLIYPSLIMFAFSIGRLYKPIFILQLPLISAERVASRFLILPFLFVIFAACTYAQKLIDHYTLTKLVKVSVVILFLILLSDLQQHLELWSPVQLGKLIKPVPQNPLDYQLSYRSDPLYFSILAAGTFISVLTLVGLAWYSKRPFLPRQASADTLSETG